MNIGKTKLKRNSVALEGDAVVPMLYSWCNR